MYSRARCGLCDQAREVIRSVGARAGRGFTFEEILIDGDVRLERDYGLRVPVVMVDGREEFELVVDPTVLAGLLEAPSAS
jgi:hypothetical protein